MKGKSLGVVNKKYRDGFERTFCNGCKEIKAYFEEHHASRSVKCQDCGKILLNPEHKTPEEG